MFPCTNNCTVFHGTNLLSAMIIRHAGIMLGTQRKLTDYGKGFYITFSLEQAKDWAHMKALNPQAYPEILKIINMSKAQYLDHPYSKIPVYLTFNIDLTQLLSLKGIVFPMPKDVYWPSYKKAWEIFVRNCRMGINHEYDFVYGPVGGRHPCCNYKMLASATKDQLSLNSIKALGCLSNLKIAVLPEFHPWLNGIYYSAFFKNSLYLKGSI